MEAITAERRLVKSPPELWAQLSDAQELARHLGEFGEIRITRLEAERTVAWEGDRARGTVELEPSGWGTKVTLTAETTGLSEPPEAEAAPEPALSPPAFDLTVEAAALEVPSPDPAPDPDPGRVPDPAPEPGPDPAPPPPRKPSFISRLFGRRRRAEPPPAAATDQLPTDSVPPDEMGPPATAAGQLAYSQEPPLPAESAPEPVDDAPEPAVEAPEAVDDAPPSVAEAVPAEPAPEVEKTAAILETVLDDLGAAHHRPFSRG